MGAGRYVKAALGRLIPGAVLVKGRRAERARVALTFDDGPHPENTPRVLDVLDREGVRATFFLQGAEAQKHPGLARSIAGRGHQVGNHGYSHLDARRSKPSAYVADTHRAQETLQDIVGTKLERIFRPPHGNVTGATFIALAGAGYRFVFWSADSRDSYIKTSEGLLTHLRSLEVGDGDILLFHEDYAHTVDTLPAILALIRGRGLGFARIDAL